MDEKSKSSPELDELQKSIEESAKKATVKINVINHEDKPSDVPNDEDTPVDSEEVPEVAENTSEEANEEDVENSDTGEIEEQKKQKKAGPEGPYKPKIDESEEDIDLTTEDQAIDDDLIETTDETEQKESQEKKLVEENVDRKVDEMLSVEKLEPVAAQVAASAAAREASEKANKSLKSRIKRFFASWWHNRKARYGTLAALFVLFTAVVLIPVTRYAVLNLFGVRVSSSLTVVDSETGLPLENMPVTLGGQNTRTGENGQVDFIGVRLGSNKLTISKLGYAVYEKDLTLGLGSNPLGEQSLQATGAQYSFVLVDWLSEKNLTGAEARSGEDVAKADQAGKIILTVGDLSPGSEITISAQGYRDEVFKISDIDQESQTVLMVPAKKHVFVSNRDGKYDLYKIDLDGTNEDLLLEASGKEREIPYVLPHQDKDIAAYISSRDGETNKDNFILDGLFIINVSNGEVERIMRSEQLQIIGWAGDKLIYVAVVEGVSAGSSQRSKAFSYDIESGERTELASSNYFNDVKLVGDRVYYSVSNYAVPASLAKLFSVGTNGSDKKTVVETQVWSIVRRDFKTLLFNATDRQWFEQEIGSSPKKLDAQPANTASREYSVSPDGKKAVWVEVRDGKGTLLSYDTESGEDTVVLAQAGLTDPVYWINNNYVVYRVDTTSETADFVKNLEGGLPEKISDVVGNRSRYFY